MGRFPDIQVPVEVKVSLKEKFKKAWTVSKVLLFSAPCGFGKTTTAAALLASRNTYYIDVRKGFDPKALRAAGNCECIVLDNLHELEDRNDCTEVLSFLEASPSVKLVGLTRGPVPGWLLFYRTRGLMSVFGTVDLVLDPMTAARLASRYGVKMTAAELSKLVEDSLGYPLGLAASMRRIAEGEEYTPALTAAVYEEMFDYFEQEIINRFDEPTSHLLLCLSLFPAFDAELAYAVTGNGEAAKILARLRKTTSMFLNARVGTDEMKMWFLWSDALRKKATSVFTVEEIRELYERAGDYYSSKGSLSDSLSCYEKAQRPDKIRKTLIDNAAALVGEGNYRSAEPFYMKMTAEEVESSPLLIYGMSILSSMQMRYEKSEEWRGKLLDFAADTSNREERRDEARVRHAFLGMVLPQYTPQQFADAVRETSKLLDETGIVPPAFSLTGGEPSLINGAHDYSGLLHSVGSLSELAKDLERVFGDEGHFFAQCAEIEFNFLQGNAKESCLEDIARMLQRAQRERLTDIEFALAALIVRIELSLGNTTGAGRIISDMIKEMELNEAPQRLIGPARALRARVAMYTGDEAAVNAWLADDAPRNIVRPRSEDSYSYLTMAFVYASKCEYRKALYALSAVLEIASLRNRVVDKIVATVLSAICHKNLNEEWKREMQGALELAQVYGYVDPLAQFGDTVQPLIIACKSSVTPDFCKKVLEEVRKKSICYPRFLKKFLVLDKPLTDTEQRVLELLCDDMSNAEIGRVLGIQIPTVKTHVSHVFAKLGCKRRADARSTAIRLGLV